MTGLVQTSSEVIVPSAIRSEFATKLVEHSLSHADITVYIFDK